MFIAGPEGYNGCDLRQRGLELVTGTGEKAAFNSRNHMEFWQN